MDLRHSKSQNRIKENDVKKKNTLIVHKRIDKREQERKRKRKRERKREGEKYNFIISDS